MCVKVAVQILFLKSKEKITMIMILLYAKKSVLVMNIHMVINVLKNVLKEHILICIIIVKVVVVLQLEVQFIIILLLVMTIQLKQIVFLNVHINAQRSFLIIQIVVDAIKIALLQNILQFKIIIVMIVIVMEAPLINLL